VATEYTTIWVAKGTPQSEQEMVEIGRMVDSGWKLVQWQPLVARPLPSPSETIPVSLFYDVFLLSKTEWDYPPALER